MPLVIGGRLFRWDKESRVASRSKDGEIIAAEQIRHSGFLFDVLASTSSSHRSSVHAKIYTLPLVPVRKGGGQEFSQIFGRITGQGDGKREKMNHFPFCGGPQLIPFSRLSREER
jgi:hypothetical protein